MHIQGMPRFASAVRGLNKIKLTSHTGENDITKSADETDSWDQEASKIGDLDIMLQCMNLALLSDPNTFNLVHN
jgi:hypothetical protein